MNARRHASLGGRSGRRLAIAGLFVLLVGVLAGWREYRASEAVQALAFDARFDQLVGATRMHFSNREAIALSVAAAFRPAAGGLDGRLEDVDPRLLTHIGDVFSMVWIARVPASRRAEAQRVLAAKRDSGAGFFGLERRPVPDGRDIVAVLDIAPRTPANLSTIGLALSELPIPSEALRRAQREQSVAATAPLSLVQLPGEKAIVLYVPLRSGSRADVSSAYIGFSYRVADLLRGLTTGAADLGPLRVVDRDVADPEAGLVFRSQGPPLSGPVSTRELSIGGRIWRVEIGAPDFARRAIRAGVITGLATALLVAALIGFALYLANRNQRLEAALAAQRLAEERLKVVAGELAHRVKNAFSMAHAVASQSFGPGEKNAQLVEAFGGRMQAMARAADLLTEDGRGSTSLSEIIASSELPCGDRVRLAGPDLSIAGEAAQSFHLLIHELWTNAIKHGALARPGGRVTLSWTGDGDRLLVCWAEDADDAPAQLPARRGFGRRLLETVLPRQLHGRGALEMTQRGLVYRLDIPADSVAG